MISTATAPKTARSCSADGLKNWQPLGDKFLVLADRGESMTDAGLHIPGAAVEVKKTGVVVLCGPDVKEPITVGTRVMWTFPGMAVVKIDEQEYLLMNETDIALIERTESQ